MSFRFVLGEYAKILCEHGESFEDAELVTPTSKHFPDAFHRDAESVETLLQRVLSYTPLAHDLVVRLGFVSDDEAEREGGGCGSGACGTKGGWARVDGALDEGDGYRVLAHVMDTSGPVRLVGQLARGAGAVLMAEAGAPSSEDIGAHSEVWAAASGFGVCLLNASHVVSKGCSGVNIHRGTALDTSSLATLLALFCGVRKIKPSAARAHVLEGAPREAFDEACRAIAANPELIEKLTSAPELLVGGVYELAPPKGLFARLFSAAKTNPNLPEAKPVRSEEQRRRLEEARALVEEAIE